MITENDLEIENNFDCLAFKAIKEPLNSLKLTLILKIFQKVEPSIIPPTNLNEIEFSEVSK